MHAIMPPTKLEDLPGLRRSEPLDEQIVVRVSTTDREQLERTAARLGVPAGRLARAILRQVLAEAAPATIPENATAARAGGRRGSERARRGRAASET